MPPKRNPAAVTCTTAQLVEDGTRLLEASKKWRMEIRSAEKAEKPMEVVTATVSCALDQLSTTQVNAIDKIKVNAERTRLATRGSEIANSLAEKAMGAASDAKKETSALAEKATKRFKELSIRTKSNLSHIQRLELARSENVVIAKGIPAMTRAGQKETQGDLRAAANAAFQATGAQGVTITYVRRLQRVKGDRGTAPPAMRISLSCLTDKLILYDAVKQKISQGIPVPYSFQNEIPKYALGLHKSLNKIAMEIRRMDRNIKTRVAMTKGDNWPVLTIKRRGETSYKPAAPELIETAKKSLNEAKKAARELAAAAAAPPPSVPQPGAAMDLRSADDDLLYDDVDMGADAAPAPTTKAGRTGMSQ